LEETSQVNTRIALQISLPDMWNLAGQPVVRPRHF
jgi:hypothetical protein